MAFLPTTKEEMLKLNISQFDFIFVTGDAYVDHPSFGTAILSRMLENLGYSVGIIAQPKYNDTTDISRLGSPKYAFLVNAGVIDSMVAHYTAAKRKRSNDAYSPGNKAGLRPDRAVIVYTKLIKQDFKDSFVIIGGLEASLRRFAHYDYWADKVMPSVLFDSGADVLSYGMGERSISELAIALKNGEDYKHIRGICYAEDANADIKGIVLPSFEECINDKRKYAKACKMQYDEHDHVYGKRLLQQHNNKILVQNPPQPPLSREELDNIYALNYERYYHPSYEKMGGVPAIQEVEFSITHNRGCFGACNFCSIAFHQGRTVTSRSESSVLSEAKLLANNPHFKGYIHDVGGPTANFRKPSCKKQKKYGMCRGKKCLAPTPCENLEVSHTEYLQLLKKISAIPKIKKVFIRSGIRFDYLLLDKDESFFKELVKNHVSGQLKVAPEHCSDFVLDKMGKPHIDTYNRFSKRFYDITKGINKKQYLVPYLMSSHPGSRIEDAIKLALFLKKNNLHPEQVQDFYPTPGTISTCMYYTGIDPYTNKDVFVPKTPSEKAMQRALLQYFKPENRPMVLKALKQAGREDLIGFGPNCLIKPYNAFKPVKRPNKKEKTHKNKWEKRY